MFRYSILFLVFLIVAPSISAAQSVIKIPAGNRNVQQPKIPFGSIKRTRSGKSTFERKFQKIHKILSRDKKLIGKIKKSARLYGIDPIHIIGALVGEHTYNVDALDRYQTYYVKALAYLNQDLSFRYKRENVMDFVKRPEFSRCNAIKSNYDLWSCREAVWNAKFRGKRTGGKSWPDYRFGRVFFQPLYAGQTFGLGQLNPLTALKVTDMVSRKSRLPRLRANKAPQVYKTIMDPDSSLLYMAAVLKNSIDVYRRYTGFDITGNPGITATLYNLGNVKSRAIELSAKNKKRAAQGKSRMLPEENYYGWLVNNKLAELRRLL